MRVTKEIGRLKTLTRPPHGCGCVVAITSHVLPKLGSVFVCPFKQDSIHRQLYYSTPRKIDSGIVHRKKHCPECIEIRITMDKCKYEKMSLLSGRVLHHMMATTSKGKRLGNDGSPRPYLRRVRIVNCTPCGYKGKILLFLYHRHAFDAGVPNFPLVPPPFLLPPMSTLAALTTLLLFSGSAIAQISAPPCSSTSYSWV